MQERYASVSEVVNEFIDDESFRERFEKEINDKRVAKTLFAIRSRAGKTQGEMAERLGCSQGTISKLENSGVDGIKVSDLVAYAQACELNLTISFHEEQSAAGRTHPESVLDVTTLGGTPAGEAFKRGVSKRS
jgi:transcriptional regulator with XRE-family HTH domain